MSGELRTRTPKPTVVVSRCLGFEACRWDGRTVEGPFVQRLAAYVDFRTVCPEVALGLGVPREPVRVVLVRGKPRLRQPATGRDLTAAMGEFAGDFLDNLKSVDGFLFTSRSPSCGLRDVKVYPPGDEAAALTARGTGVFARAVGERFPGVVALDEARLRNVRLRDHFLIRVFANAALREVKRSRRMRALVDFHARNKFLLMAYNQNQLRALGRIVANHPKRPWPEVVAAYENRFAAALVRPAAPLAHINVLMHTLGYVSRGLSHTERSFFLAALERYREGCVPLSEPADLMRSFAIRCREPFLLAQTYFEPYPAALFEPAGFGEGRVPR